MATNTSVTDRYLLDARVALRHRSGQLLSVELGGTHAVLSGPRAYQHKRVVAGQLKDYLGPTGSTPPPRSLIAVVDVIGPLSQRAEYLCGWVEGYDSITSRVIEALSAPEVASLVVRIDSPGGDVAGLEEAISAIVSAREEFGKPIAVYVDEMAASAAYWLACGIADAGIYAPASASVGSIGAYTMIRDETAALTQSGVAVTIVRDPPGKDASNPLGPVLDVAIARESERVRDASSRFASAVSSARGLSIDLVRELNGACLSATRALEIGLIDEIRSMASTLIAAEPQNGKIMANIRAADPEPQDTGGRATAAEVSAAATACATACTDAAAACDGGTADEAIAATSAMLVACDACKAVGESFLGGGEAPAKPADSPEDTPAPDAPTARVLQLLEQLTRERAQAAEQAERAKLIRGRAMSSDVRAWLESPSTSLADVRAACRVLPESYDAHLAADVTVQPRAGVGGGLTERELKICKDTGCTPERFLKLREQRDRGRA